MDSAEATRVLATYAAELMKRKMDAMYEASGDQALSDQIAYINKVIGSMDVETASLRFCEKRECFWQF